MGYTVPCCRNALNQCDPCIFHPGTPSVTTSHFIKYSKYNINLGGNYHISVFVFCQPFSFLFLLEAVVCLKTVKPVTTEPGKPTTTSLSTENIAQSVVKAGAVGTVKVSCTGE